MTMILPPKSLLIIDAPWLLPLPRPRIDRAHRPKPDPEQVALQCAIVNSFAVRPDKPYEYAAISVVITGAPTIPAAGALKLIIDAVVHAGFIRDDRNEVLAARLTRSPMTVNSDETVNVAVLERKVGDSAFIREIWPRRTCEPVSPVVAQAVGYSYVTGRPGAVTFMRPDMMTPEEYSRHLVETLRSLEDQDSLFVADRWTASPSAGLGIIVRVPMRGNFDPDNVLLYALDLVETARREVIGQGGVTIDQMLSEVAVCRSDEPGVQIHMYECDVLDEETGLSYFREDADGIISGWPANPRRGQS